MTLKIKILHHIFNRFYYIIILTIFNNINLNISKGDNTYPISYTISQVYNGGELIPVSIEKGKILNYFIKPNWANQTEFLTYWYNYPKNDAKTLSLGEMYCLANTLYGSKALIIGIDHKRIFVELLDTNFNNTLTSEIYNQWENTPILRAKWLEPINSYTIPFIINETLFIVQIQNDKLSVAKVGDNVIEAQTLKVPYIIDSTSYTFLYIERKEALGYLNFVNSFGAMKTSTRIPLNENVYIYTLKENVIVITSAETFNQSFLQIIDNQIGNIASGWIETNGDNVVSDNIGNDIIIYYLKNDDNKYYLVTDNLSKKNEKDSYKYINIPEGFIEPLCLRINQDNIFALFRNGLIIFDRFGEIQSADFYPFGELFKDKPNIKIIDDYLIFSSPSVSVVFEKKTHSLWFLNRFLNNTGKIVLPTILIIALLIFIQLYNNKNNLLKAVVDLPSSGAVYIIDRVGRLIIANKTGKNIIGITESIPLKRLFQYYCVLEETNELRALVERGLTTKETFTQKIGIIKDNNVTEWFCTIVPMRNITGRFKGLVLTCIDITEELERKRLSNWAQLAHDMQTNLSTIRLNAELLEAEKNSDNLDRKNKILHQVKILIQRIRDIVTVGRTDAAEKQENDAFQICQEVLAEFDSTMFPNVEFRLNAPHYHILCDRPKMVRAIRNTIENGIKALQGKDGIISLEFAYDTRNVYFKIKDNGIGMDEKTKAKMLTPYFTTTKNKGSSGIGTMIVQHVVELHGGEILINSEKGVGTEIILKLPNLSKNRPQK